MVLNLAENSGAPIHANVWSRSAHQQSESGATIRPDHSAQSGEMGLSVVLFRVDSANHWIDDGFDAAPTVVAQDDFSRLHDAGAAMISFHKKISPIALLRWEDAVASP
ncbi:hypothetical protein [Mesorhizobium sp. L103C131B0]|uniref:hypothetical protein n=1 Tax=Mesorhizobium sp. L103C131B0 TaxID=1287089 RepID=UPI0012DE1C0E|nr:hypothetical protein [Mesorhizobium sp. L103C131B0]